MMPGARCLPSVTIGGLSGAVAMVDDDEAIPPLFAELRQLAVEAKALRGGQARLQACAQDRDADTCSLASIVM